MEGKYVARQISAISEKEREYQNSNKNETPVGFEEALNLTGFGKYNYNLLAACSIIIAAMGMDIFGNSFIVPAAACDLDLNISERGILSAIPFLGIILTAHFWGYTSDTKGRKLTLAWSMTASAVLSFLSSFSPNWIVMAVLKFLSTCFSSASHASTYSLLGESCPLRWRSRLLLMLGSALTFSEGIAAMFVYPILPLTFSYDMDFIGIQYRPWRLLVQVLALVSGFGALLLFFFHESPKFLAVQSREDEALAVLQKIYASNSGDLPENFPVKVLRVEEAKCAKGSSILISLWQQTAPLFQRPLLKNTVKLFYVTAIVYFASNSLSMWLPFVVNSSVSVLESGSGEGLNLCGLLNSKNAMSPENVTYTGEEVVCDDTMSGTTIITVILAGAAYMLLNILMSFVPYKKALALSILLICGVTAVGTVVAYQPMIALSFFLIFQTVSLVMAIVSAYYVELYPTTLRGMISCLGVMVGRASGFFGIAVLGFLVEDHCDSAMYAWGALVFSALLVCILLPSDKKTKKLASQGC